MWSYQNTSDISYHPNAVLFHPCNQDTL
jgi:hypothetical protein